MGTSTELDPDDPSLFEVIIQKENPGVQIYEEVMEFLQINCKGKWGFDWMHGSGRSEPPEVRAQERYVFVDKEDATRFKLRFG